MGKWGLYEAGEALADLSGLQDVESDCKAREWPGGDEKNSEHGKRTVWVTRRQMWLELCQAGKYWLTADLCACESLEGLKGWPTVLQRVKRNRKQRNSSSPLLWKKEVSQGGSRPRCSSDGVAKVVWKWGPYTATRGVMLSDGFIGHPLMF